MITALILLITSSANFDSSKTRCCIDNATIYRKLSSTGKLADSAIDKVIGVESSIDSARTISKKECECSKSVEVFSEKLKLLDEKVSWGQTWLLALMGIFATVVGVIAPLFITNKNDKQVEEKIKKNEEEMKKASSKINELLMKSISEQEAKLNEVKLQFGGYLQDIQTKGIEQTAKYLDLATGLYMIVANQFFVSEKPYEGFVKLLELMEVYINEWSIFGVERFSREMNELAEEARKKAGEIKDGTQIKELYSKVIQINQQSKKIGNEININNLDTLQQELLISYTNALLEDSNKKKNQAT